MLTHVCIHFWRGYAMRIKILKQVYYATINKKLPEEKKQMHKINDHEKKFIVVNFTMNTYLSLEKWVGGLEGILYLMRIIPASLHMNLHVKIM